MIQGQRVRQARELNHFTQTDLIEHLPGLKQHRLSRVENDLAYLDDETAELIAVNTGVTHEWLSRPPVDGLRSLSPHFRARSRVTESSKAAGRAWADLVLEAHMALGERTRPIPVRLEPLHGLTPIRAAATVRQLLGFDLDSPLPYLILAAERLGVRVLGLPLRADGLDAFCGWAGSDPALAVLSDAPGDRLRWSVAHELGHLVLHGMHDRGADVEDEADVFAAELLTPSHIIGSELTGRTTLQGMTMLKTRWGVSVKSLVRRSKELGVVDGDRATSLYRQISSRGWNKAEPGFVPQEKPRALRKMVEIAYGRGGSSSFARDMGWSGELTHRVLVQHASAEELPHEGPSTISTNVVSLSARRRAHG